MGPFLFMKKILNIYRCNTTNLGDLLSAPYLYFEKLGNKIADIKHFKYQDKADVVIVGGGALISRLKTKWINWFLDGHGKVKPKQVILWGVGGDQDSIDWFRQVSNICWKPLVFQRDKVKYKYSQYGPCVSCMHKLFGKHKIKNSKKILGISASKKPLGHSQYFDAHIDNEFKSLQEFIDIVNDYEFIVTSCYHPALWSTWLGKKVIVSIDAKHTAKHTFKLYHMAHQPIVCRNNIQLNNKNELDTLLQQAKTFPTAHEQDRTRTEYIWNQVHHMC